MKYLALTGLLPIIAFVVWTLHYEHLRFAWIYLISCALLGLWMAWGIYGFYQLINKWEE